MIRSSEDALSVATGTLPVDWQWTWPAPVFSGGQIVLRASQWRQGQGDCECTARTAIQATVHGARSRYPFSCPCGSRQGNWSATLLRTSSRAWPVSTLNSGSEPPAVAPGRPACDAREHGLAGRTIFAVAAPPRKQRIGVGSCQGGARHTATASKDCRNWFGGFCIPARRRCLRALHNGRHEKFLPVATRVCGSTCGAVSILPRRRQSGGKLLPTFGRSRNGARENIRDHGGCSSRVPASASLALSCSTAVECLSRKPSLARGQLG